MMDNTTITNFEMLDEYIQCIENGKLKKQISSFFKLMHDRLKECPASNKLEYHNSFPGGLLDHSIRVVQIALDIFGIFQKFQVEMTCTESDIIVASLLHDIGKLGTLDDLYYIPQDNEWRKENLGEHYKYNADIPIMPHSHRSIFLLQQIGIEVSLPIWKAIIAHDGLYTDTNRSYFITMPSSKDDILMHIIHQADIMSAITESNYRIHSNNDDDDEPKKELSEKEFNKITDELLAKWD